MIFLDMNQLQPELKLYFSSRSLSNASFCHCRKYEKPGSLHDMIGFLIFVMLERFVLKIGLVISIILYNILSK